MLLNKEIKPFLQSFNIVFLCERVKDGVVDWYIVSVEMPLTWFEEY